LDVDTPVGAGLCVRKQVADFYSSQLASDPIRKGLDRRGNSLDGAGDLDLVYTSRLIDLGWGTFPNLHLTHMIPKNRVTKRYLLDITESASASLVTLGSRIGREMPQNPHFLKRYIKSGIILARDGWMDFRFYLAQQRGIRRGHKTTKTFDNTY
jgi:hypothetical protein